MNLSFLTSFLLITFAFAMADAVACSSQTDILQSSVQNCNQSQGQAETISCVTQNVYSQADYLQCQTQYDQYLAGMLAMIANGEEPPQVEETPEVQPIEPEVLVCDIEGPQGYMMSLLSECVGTNDNLWTDRYCAQNFKENWAIAHSECNDTDLEHGLEGIYEVIHRHYVVSPARYNYESMFATCNLDQLVKTAQAHCVGKRTLNNDAQCIRDYIYEYRNEAFARGDWQCGQASFLTFYPMVDAIESFYQAGGRSEFILENAQPNNTELAASFDLKRDVLSACLNKVTESIAHNCVESLINISNLAVNYHNDVRADAHKAVRHYFKSAFRNKALGLGCNVEDFIIDTVEVECAHETETNRIKACYGKNANEWFATQIECKEQYIQAVQDIFPNN